MSTEQRLIGQFHKNSVDILKVNLQDYKGHTYIDIRVWHMENPAEPGSEQPTHKGITLNVEMLPKLINFLQQAEEALANERKAGTRRNRPAYA